MTLLGSSPSELPPEMIARFCDRCVFAVHNVLSDTPFSKLDLIACRNLLIYLAPAFQKRLLSIFHFALKPGGVLFLGGAETIGSSSN